MYFRMFSNAKRLKSKRVSNFSRETEGQSFNFVGVNNSFVVFWGWPNASFANKALFA